MICSPCIDCCVLGGGIGDSTGAAGRGGGGRGGAEVGVDAGALVPEENGISWQ